MTKRQLTEPFGHSHLIGRNRAKTVAAKTQLSVLVLINQNVSHELPFPSMALEPNEVS